MTWEIIQGLVILLVTIISGYLKTEQARSEKTIDKLTQSIEHIKSNYVERNYLDKIEEHINKTIKASENRILDKIDFLAKLIPPRQ